MALESELVLERNELDPGLAGRLREALASGGIRRVATVTDAVISKLTISGSAADCLDRPSELVEAGVSYPAACLLGGTPELAIEVMASLPD